MLFSSLIHTLCAFSLALFPSASPSALPILQNVRKVVHPELPRLVIYFQTTHNHTTGEPISMLPLITEKGIALTHLIVCSFHLGNSDGVIHLNDYPPDAPLFSTLWNETVIMQQAGVKVMGMVGGAAPGSFNQTTLDSTNSTAFEFYYGQLAGVIRKYNLQGMDLDVEQYMSQAGIARLVARLNSDFGDEFIITLAPVASALRDGSNLSGFNYKDLEADTIAQSTGEPMIDFMNAQFYNGFGTLNTPTDFEAVVEAGWPPSYIIAGQLTNTGFGPTDFVTLSQTVTTLMHEFGNIGGIMGWEYFNSMPGDTDAPWEWAQEMTAILRPEYPGKLSFIFRRHLSNLNIWLQRDPEGIWPSITGPVRYARTMEDMLCSRCTSEFFSRLSTSRSRSSSRTLKKKKRRELTANSPSKSHG